MRSQNLAVLTAEIKARHPGVVIYGIGDDAHKLRTSDHNEDDTTGSRAAQSDADTNPEHRAIDVMLGPAFSVAQAYTLINEILGNARLRARLWYINFQNYQWSRSNGWVRRDNSDDPHPSHVHFSALASDDENTAGWLAGEGDTEVLKATRGMGQNGAPPHDNVLFLQRMMNHLIEGDPRLAEHPLSVDGNYGGQTAYWVSVLLTGGAGDVVDGDWFGRLVSMVASKRGNQEVGAHAVNMPHGGEIPDTATFTIPEQRVTAVLS